MKICKCGHPESAHDADGCTVCCGATLCFGFRDSAPSNFSEYIAGLETRIDELENRMKFKK